MQCNPVRFIVFGMGGGVWWAGILDTGGGWSGRKENIGKYHLKQISDFFGNQETILRRYNLVKVQKAVCRLSIVR